MDSVELHVPDMNAKWMALAGWLKPNGAHVAPGDCLCAIDFDNGSLEG